MENAAGHATRSWTRMHGGRSFDAFLWILILAVFVHGQVVAWRVATHRTCDLRLKNAFISIPPIDRFHGEVHLPGSKSLSNRVLLLSALSEGMTVVNNLLESEDTKYMLDALRKLQIDIDVDHILNQVTIKGKSGPLIVSNEKEISLFLGNAGTAMRPLVASLAAAYGNFVLDGTHRMRERPIQDLVDALRQLGVEISCSSTGCPPVYIHSNGLHGGIATISGKISSQYLSALLMVAPLSKEPITLVVKDRLMSAPYVRMTIELMKQFGVKVDASEDMQKFIIYPSQYRSPRQITIEGDASSASYFLAGAALCQSENNRITVHGCGEQSIQGDIRFAKLLRKMGASVQFGENSITLWRDNVNTPLQGIDEDCSDIPDAAMTLAIVSIFAEGKTVIRNVYNWRVKESERMHAMVTELRKLGVVVEEGEDYLVVHGLGASSYKLNDNVCIDTYDDHRMAMCFALAACGGVTVNIQDPGCVSKTFPEYFNLLKKLTSDQ